MKTLAEMILDTIENAKRNGHSFFRVDVRNADWMLIELAKELGTKVEYGPVSRIMLNDWSILTDMDNRNRLIVQKNG